MTTHRQQIEEAYAAGFLAGIEHGQSWDDMHDWLALTTRDYADGVLGPRVLIDATIPQQLVVRETGDTERDLSPAGWG